MLLVDAQERISERPVVLGSVQNDRWIVSDGLAPGDRVVVEGVQHVRPGDQVRIDNPAKDVPSIAKSTGQ
ncbi:Multidrug efflux pump subunit AcrA precursor [compost metagenome]